jgi:hypothetical protein
MIHLESLQFKKLYETNFRQHYHPFECVYAAGNSMPSYIEYNKAKLISDSCFTNMPSHIEQNKTELICCLMASSTYSDFVSAVLNLGSCVVALYAMIVI